MYIHLPRVYCNYIIYIPKFVNFTLRVSNYAILIVSMYIHEQFEGRTKRLRVKS